jgi:GNAT superfamily N-acetyltransferase
MEFIIRQCTELDIAAIRALELQWQEEGNTVGLVASSEEYLCGKLGDYFLVAEHQGRIAGYTYGSIHTAKEMCIFPDGTGYIEIDGLYVCPEFRHSGIGGQLLDAVLKAAKDNGIERSCLYSSSKDMDGIIRFYRKHGYGTWYIQMFK